MDPESKELLEQTFKLSKENNEMLLKIRQIQKREGILRVLKVLFVIGIGVGAFYFIQPYVDAIKELFNNISGGLNELGNFKDSIDTLKNLPK